MKTTLRLILAAFGLAILTLSVQAEDYTYITNNGTITITAYTGPGGDVTIPDTINGLPVTSIGYAAFAGYTNLTSVTIPNSVTSIGDWAFQGCSSLTAIIVDALNPSYASVDGVLFNKSQTTLVQYPIGQTGTFYTIPNSVTNIGVGAFAFTSLTSVTIGTKVSSIGSGAFWVCTNLTNFTIPDCVTVIKGASYMPIPNFLVPPPVFGYCTSLTNVTIGNGVTSIEACTFFGCTSLASVTIGKSVTNLTSITWEAAPFGPFSDCGSLTSVYFRGNAPDSSEYVFDGDDNVTIYYLPGTTGWSATFADRPTALWVLPYPLILTTAPSFGIQTNGFGFIISWATNLSVVVEASSNLANPVWSPVRTNTLTDGWSYFSDPDWANYPSRFYRIRSP